MTAGTREGISHDIGVDGSVDIRGDQGAVELRAVDGTSIRVQASGDRSLEDAFRIETGSGSFKMSATTSEGPGRHLVGRPTPPILVDVPRTARVRVETVSGEIQADGLHGTQRYRTMSGDMRLESTLGRIALDTVSGDVRIRSGGDLTIEARTVSGDLDVAAETIRSLQTQATSGEVRLAGRFAEAGPFGIETVSGDVTISPVGAVRVEGTTVSGDVRSSIPHTAGGRAGHRTIELGHGGPVIAFRSISGDLRVTDDRPNATAEPASSSPAPGEPTDHAADEVRLAILRELESGAIDTAEAERRLAALDEPAGLAPAALRGASAPEHLDWVRRV